MFAGASSYWLGSYLIFRRYGHCDICQNYIFVDYVTHSNRIEKFILRSISSRKKIIFKPQYLVLYVILFALPHFLSFLMFFNTGVIMHIEGALLLAIISPSVILLTCLIYRKKAHPFIRCRVPNLLLVELIMHFFALMLFCLCIYPLHLFLSSLRICICYL